MNSEYGTASLGPWRASNCLTTVSTTRPITSQMPMFFRRLFNAAPRDALRASTRRTFAIRCGGAAWMRPQFDSIRSGQTQPVSCQSGVSDRRRLFRKLHSSAFQALADQIHLAAAVAGCLRLPYVDLRKMRFQRTPKLRKSLALECFDDEITSRLQPCLREIERELAEMDRPGLIGGLHAG